MRGHQQQEPPSCTLLTPRWFGPRNMTHSVSAVARALTWSGKESMLWTTACRMGSEEAGLSDHVADRASACSTMLLSATSRVNSAHSQQGNTNYRARKGTPTLRRTDPLSWSVEAMFGSITAIQRGIIYILHMSGTTTRLNACTLTGQTMLARLSLLAQHSSPGPNPCHGR